MQNKLLESCDDCRAVNTRKDYYEPEAPSGRAFDKNTSHEVCVCLSCTDSSHSEFQHNASFLPQWRTCLQHAVLK